MSHALIKNEEIFCFVESIPNKDDMFFEYSIDIWEEYDYKKNYKIETIENEKIIVSELKEEFKPIEVIVDPIVEPL